MTSQSIVHRIDPRDRQEIERILAPLLARWQAALRLFGSRARGDARRTSDIDLACSSERPISPAELSVAREALEESRIPFRIDLVDYCSAQPQLREAIDREGIVWPA
jgi:predicted nucleotidyltransferase